MTEIFLIFSIVMTILLPVILASLLRRHCKVPWMWFSVGILTFSLSQTVHIPLNRWLANAGFLNSPAQPGSQPIWQIALLAGLTAGICEELARVLGYLAFRKARSVQDGIMMGLGHGGIESMVFVGVQLAVSLGTISMVLYQNISPAQFPGLSTDQIMALQSQVNQIIAAPWNAFLPLIERIFILGIHVTLSVMVLQSFTSRNPLWIIVAIVYHALIDAAAVIGVHYLENAWLIELSLFTIALPGYIWFFYKIRSEKVFVKMPVNPLRLEIKLLLTTTAKEFLQLWRTKRVLIIVAVFGLFGLMSPLMAYFLPNLMTAIPGAEAFASLIPTPTAGDAVVQYHKNITQFGFLLAIILGMGMVAGEKERGTVTLVLSKPLPRWAFLLSKLIALSCLFSLGFILAAIGGYFYTDILFGNIDSKIFLEMNLVLIIWILPFISLTLLGSVLAGTTTAAGGISLALVVLLLLSSSLPLISSLMPGALSQWAAQLGALAAGVAASTPGSLPYPDMPIKANYGAISMVMVIILVSLVVSFGFFERQEF